MSKDELALLGLISLIRNEVETNKYAAVQTIPAAYPRAECCQEAREVVDAVDILVLLDEVELGIRKGGDKN